MKKVIPEDSVLVPDQAREVFKGQIFSVYQWQQQLYDGSMETFELLKRTDTVSVIAVVEDKILVLDDEQPYFGTRKSIPGGRIDPEDPSVQAAAEREVREETGYTFKNWRLIKVTQPVRKIEWFVYLLLAWDVQDRQEPKPDSGEKITLHQLSFDEVKQLVMNRAGYLGENYELFGRLSNLNDLLKLSSFSGPVVDR